MLKFNEVFLHVWFQSRERLIAVRGSEVLIGELDDGSKEIEWSPYWDIGPGRLASGGLGRYLAHYSRTDGSIAVADLESKSPVLDLPKNVAAEFAPSGRWIATLHGNTLSPSR